jgi:phage repressor protein C with HTH and peptisase S24 domain
MASKVSERFVKCIDQLKENNTIKSLRQMALALDYTPQNLNEIYNGKRDATIDLIKTAVEVYNINPNYLFTGQGPSFSEDVDNLISEKNQLDKIVYVPMAAHAGYAEQYTDPLFVSDLINFSLPDYKFHHGTYRCFDVVGDSMEPSLYAGDKVVCSQVDMSYYKSAIRANHVYVLVLQDGIVVKRLTSAQDSKSIKCVSDNDYYNPYDVSLEDIRQLWYVEVKISPFLPSPNNIRQAFHSEMDSMRQLINSQSQSIQMLNQTIEKLLKQNRM